jgi:hypothetical protein
VHFHSLMTLDSLPFVQHVPPHAVCFPLNDTLLRALRDPNFAHTFYAEIEKNFALLEVEKPNQLDEDTQALYQLLEHKEFLNASKKNLDGIVNQLHSAAPNRLATAILDGKLHIVILPSPVKAKNIMHFTSVSGKVVAQGVYPVVQWLEQHQLSGENKLVYANNNPYITQNPLN